MYAKHRIGIILSSPDILQKLLDRIRSVPQYVDRIYVLSDFTGKDLQGLPATSDLSRFHFLKAGRDQNRQAYLDQVYRQMIEDGMDIAVVVAEPDLDPTFLTFILDPIIWGVADYTTGMRYPRQDMPSIDNHAPVGMNGTISFSNFISFSRIDTGNFRGIDTSRGYSAFSLKTVRKFNEYIALLGPRKVLAAIPCLNEGVTIGSVVLKARKYVSEVLVVDDGSSDGTGKVAGDAGATVISHSKNLGKAEAVGTALKYAVEKDFDIMILLDGDGQHDPEEIPAIARPLLQDQADLVIGSRFLGSQKDIPFYRKIGQGVLTRITNLNTSVSTTDSQSGFRGLNRKAISGLDMGSEGYNIESDMISHLSARGMRIQEIPIRAIYEVPHKHKKNPFSHGYDVLAHIIGQIGYSRPLLMFGVSGFIFTILGVAFGFLAFSVYYASNKLPYIYSITSIVFLILGLLMITSGLILNSLVVIMKIKMT